MVELVYKLDEKSYRECLIGESIAKVRFNCFDPQYIYMDINTDHFTRCACGVKICTYHSKPPEKNPIAELTKTEVELCKYFESMCHLQL